MRIQLNSLRLTLICVCVSTVGLTNVFRGDARTPQIQSAQPQLSGKHPMTVADSIRMTRFGDPDYTSGASSNGILAKFSSDGKRFTVVLKKGNLEQNTNEYSLILFDTTEALRTPSPVVLLSLASTSNRPAISKVTWLADNDTIIFLGERPGELQALYTFNCTTKELKKVTNHPTNLTSYAVGGKGDPIVFLAEPPIKKISNEDALRNGVTVSTQWLSDLVRGEYLADTWGKTQLFLERQDSAAPTLIAKEGWIIDLSLSPDGKYLIVESQVPDVPESWKDFEDQFLTERIRQKRPKGVPAMVFQYMLVDTMTGTSQPLLDAPVSFLGSEVAWSPDSQSVVVAGVYLPLDVTDAAERKTRQSKTFVAEIKVPSRQIVKVTDKDLKLLKWDPKTNKVLLEIGRVRIKEGPRVAYRKTGTEWQEVQVTPADLAANERLDVVLEEDLNSPPRIVVVDPQTQQKKLLLDLNPQFSELEFGKVEAVTWKATDGHDVEGGLYRPPDYVAGKRYPLIIQTHGFTPEKFWVDGPWPTAFAAQPLAGKGFVVLQVGAAKNLQDDIKTIATPQEAIREMAAYEGAIDYLDKIGLIDRDHVGIIGFSRTCFHVKYTLTHSKYRFSAAVVADGIDAGYSEYLNFSTANSELALELEKMNGGLPFGEGISSWLKLSPSFGLGKVQTPLRIQAIGPTSVLGEWEWYAGLSRLGRPVDMIYLPDGEHILEKPWERMVSQQGDVDWFCFWLRGDEDPDPAKIEQYIRWRGLRKLQESHLVNQTPTAPAN